MSRIPLDVNAVPLPGFSYTGTRANLTAGVATSNVAVPTGSAGKEVVIRASAPVFVNFGTSGVTAAQDAGSTLWSGAELIYKVPAAATHMAAIRIGAADIIVQLELLSDTA
jgi:hypothetical protein